MVPGLPPQDLKRRLAWLVIEIAQIGKVEWERDAATMIEVTKLNGEKIIVNADHIESVEGQPDTALVLTNGKRIVIRDRIPEVVRKVVEYQRSIRLAAGPRVGPTPSEPGR